MTSNADGGEARDRSMAANRRERAVSHADVINRDSVHYVDDGGGREGAFLIELARRNPHPSGTVPRLPHAAARARELVRRETLEERIIVDGNSLFDAILRGADGFVLSANLHDWPDEQALRIPQCCRAAKTDDAVLLGDRERSRTEYLALFASADLVLDTLTPTVTTFSVMMARLALRAS